MWENRPRTMENHERYPGDTMAIEDNDWDALSKAQQKAKVLDALDAATRGLFDLASTHLSQVFAENHSVRPWPHPDTNLPGLENVTLDTLRAELERLGTRPVQDPPDFL